MQCYRIILFSMIFHVFRVFNYLFDLQNSISSLNTSTCYLLNKNFFSQPFNYSSLSKRLEKILEHLFANVPKIQLDCPSLIKDG